MLTKKDIQQINELLTGQLKPLKEDVSSLKTDTATLKSDASSLKTDVSSLKSDVSTLKSDVSSLKSDMSSVKLDVGAVRQHNVRIEMKLIDMEQKFETNAFQWKSELFTKIDTVLGRLVTSEQENAVHKAQEPLVKRVKKLEQHVGLPTPVSS